MVGFLENPWVFWGSSVVLLMVNLWGTSGLLRWIWALETLAFIVCCLGFAANGGEGRIATGFLGGYGASACWRIAHEYRRALERLS